ncbi:hypothetical protein C5167_039160 [Papaver somniferum]|uniref:Uncharacterized protein n=1 Tax=Papaver somniferum TaxID=3469 RepID=A0A4Y7IFK6_PAPSO|nr:uncharacterized protein LOC113303729 [Papaver somniferum]RZC46209.1 hypothetical protein C5167_039160 [Papaver somniferum]
MGKKPWKIIPRPLLESVLNNHAQHHKVPQPLILHGPRGVGKSTLILNRLLEDWNKGPHFTGYVDFSNYKENFKPWASHSTTLSTKPTLNSLRFQLEQCLEQMIGDGVRLGVIGSHQVFTTLNKSHGLNTALRRILQSNTSGNSFDRKISTSVLWDRAVFAMSSKTKVDEIDEVIKGKNDKGKIVKLKDKAYLREAMLSLKLAKEVIDVQQSWRASAIAELNRNGGFSRTLANSSTDWPCLLLELLSAAAEVDHFQPKLVIDNIEVLKDGVLIDDSTVSASMYHDSFLWRLISLCVNERCLPVILITSDSYYSYRAYMDFGFPDLFISRETFGWTLQEAKMHTVTEYFTESEWKLISEVLGPNPRQLSELYALKQNSNYQKITENSSNTFEDILEAYLAYIQVTVVNPAMESVLSILQKFAVDAQNGRISKDRLRFGAPWRHPPRIDDPAICLEWAKLQVLDFLQSLVKSEFGYNYLADCSLEIMDDPCANAMVEVGLLYAQRDPSFVRPVSGAIQRCLARWLVQEQMQMSFQQSLRYWWQRAFRGRSYRHLMKEVGYK